MEEISIILGDLQSVQLDQATPLFTGLLKYISDECFEENRFEIKCVALRLGTMNPDMALPSGMDRVTRLQLLDVMIRLK